VIYVLDTNAVSALMKGNPAVVERLAATEPAGVTVPQPVLAEIAFGIERLPPKPPIGRQHRQPNGDEMFLELEGAERFPVMALFERQPRGDTVIGVDISAQSRRDEIKHDDGVRVIRRAHGAEARNKIPGPRTHRRPDADDLMSHGAQKQERQQPVCDHQSDPHIFLPDFHFPAPSG